MSSPSMPPDNSMQVQQMQNDRADAAQKAQDAKDLQTKNDLAGLRTTAQSQGTQSAQDWFQQQGLDPAAHQQDISSTINSILGGIPQNDPNPGGYFKDVGATVGQNVQKSQQAAAGRSLDQLFAPDFQTQRLPFTLDDPYLKGVDAEQRSTADQTVKNMLDRGTITPTGYAAAETDLGNQDAGVMSRLNEIGTGLISSGQQSLLDEANKGRTAASTLNIDQPFNASTFGNEVDRLTNEFIGNLGQNIRSRVTGNLFNTAGLGALAGAAQGAQNTAFDPNAAAAIDPNATKKPTDTTSSPLF